MLVLAHLGLMKTGTTTIQSTLRRNAGVLKGRVAVATCDEPTAAVRRYGQRLVQKARRDAEAGLREALAGLRDRVRRGHRHGVEAAASCLRFEERTHGVLV